MDPQKALALATVAGRLAAGLARFTELAEALQVDAVEMARLCAALADDHRQGGPRHPLDN